MKRWNMSTQSARWMLALTLCLTTIWPAAASAESVEVSRIQANTYVGDPGEMVESFDITIANPVKYQNLKASDFEITGNYDGYPLNEAEEIVQTNYADDGIKLTIQDHTIHMEVEPFKYPGGMISKFKVTNKTYPELSFDETNVDKVVTRTVDDFEKGTYTGSNGETLSYRLKRSPSTNAQPLVVWLHGGGEVGTDGRSHLTANRGAVVWTESGYDTSVLAVQYPENYSFKIYDNTEQLAKMQAYFVAQYELIQKLVAEGEVDPDRIYLAGVSSGGGGALRFMMQYPDLFAGAVVIAAKDTVADYTGSVDGFKDALKDIVNVPIWLHHAKGDPTTDSRTSILAYEALLELGSDPDIFVYDDDFMEGNNLYGGLKHWSWVPALASYQTPDFLFNQDKGISDADIYTRMDRRIKAYEIVDRTQLAVWIADFLKLPNPQYEESYSDTFERWSQKAISQVTEAGVMQGTGNNKFSPLGDITRAQLAVILDKMKKNLGIEPDQSEAAMFDDVPPTHWAYEAIRNSSQYDIMGGKEAQLFAPNDVVDGEEFHDIMGRLYLTKANRHLED
ncbi:S-layer homology domain-containing protein [Paenibacillus sp. FSL K6-4396]|uniref:S-layer homology domain-containing protein n=2 Tax=Paenibacillus TaxID=44249 RepID=UPI0030F640CB